jgi:hypothetical protein
MRRSASEIINNLEMRVARLEKQTHQKIAVDGTDYDTITTAYDDEIQSFESLSSVLKNARNREVMSLKVFLRCLSLKRANNLALKLSKKLNIKGWEKDSDVLTYALMLKTKYGIEGIGRVFTMIADFLKLKKLEQTLKGVRLLAPLYKTDDFMDLWDLMLGSNGVSLDVFDKMQLENENDEMVDEGEVGVANYGGADVYDDTLNLYMERTGDYTIPLGVNTDQFNEHLVIRLSEELDEAMSEEQGFFEDVADWFEAYSGEDTEFTIQNSLGGNRIEGSYTYNYTKEVNAEDYYSEY